MTGLGHVGVVIVTYASSAHVGATLTALPAAQLAQIVVVDNASPDDTVAVVKALGIANLTLVEQDNVGFGAGNNAGVRALLPDVEFALLLNPDCVLPEPDLTALVDYLSAHPACALVAPRIVKDGVAATAGGALPTLRTEIAGHLPSTVGRRLGERAIPGGTETSGPVGYVEGAAMLVRLDAFRAVGGFDERYFLCFEEIDLAHRLARAGWTIDLCALATATHTGQASRRQVAAFSRYHQYRSQEIYLQRWSGRTRARAYAFIAVTSWALQRLRGRLSPAEFRASVDGVFGRPFRG